MVWHWNCASALCKNNWRTKGISYYSLPVNPDLRQKYSSVLKNSNINWSKQVICSAHWTGGVRNSIDHIPDIVCSDEQLKKFELENSKTPTKELKQKIVCVRRLLVVNSDSKQTTAPQTASKRKAPRERLLIPTPEKKKKNTRRI